MALRASGGVCSGGRKCVGLPPRLFWCGGHRRCMTGRCSSRGRGFWCPPLGCWGGVLGPRRSQMWLGRMLHRCRSRKESLEDGKMSEGMIAWLKSGLRGEVGLKDSVCFNVAVCSFL